MLEGVADAGGVAGWVIGGTRLYHITRVSQPQISRNRQEYNAHLQCRHPNNIIPRITNRLTSIPICSPSRPTLSAPAGAAFAFCPFCYLGV